MLTSPLYQQTGPAKSARVSQGRISEAKSPVCGVQRVENTNLMAPGDTDACLGPIWCPASLGGAGGSVPRRHRQAHRHHPRTNHGPHRHRVRALGVAAGHRPAHPASRGPACPRSKQRRSPWLRRGLARVPQFGVWPLPEVHRRQPRHDHGPHRHRVRAQGIAPGARRRHGPRPPTVLPAQGPSEGEALVTTGGLVVCHGVGPCLAAQAGQLRSTSGR